MTAVFILQTGFLSVFALENEEIKKQDISSNEVVKAEDKTIKVEKSLDEQSNISEENNVFDETLKSENNDSTLMESVEYFDFDAENLKQEFSKNGNKVTQYVNQEDGKTKTIIWTQGIEPPIMSNDNTNQFVRKEEVSNGEKFVTYISPYYPNNGWYDVNKDYQHDSNLCFAAGASNALQWWLAQNEIYIDKYLAITPNYPEDKGKRLEQCRKPVTSQYDSNVYASFVAQYTDRPDGYWPDILQDQFINGYRGKTNGGVNDVEVDAEGLLTKGPDSRGGFFFDVFGITKLTERRYYSTNYDAFSKDLKQLLLDGNMILMDYNMGGISHLVTIWGAEYDSDGTVSAIYMTDSDDPQSNGMVRYRVINKGGPAITTRVDNKSTNFIQHIEILSPATQLWEDYFNENKIEVGVDWTNTNITYNGKIQKPKINVSNIQAGHDVKVFVQGEQKNIGKYEAKAVLYGKDANKYKIDKSKETVQYSIDKIGSNVNLNAIHKDDGNEKYVTLSAEVTLNNRLKPNGTVTFKNGNTVIKSDVTLNRKGVAIFDWKSIPDGDHEIVAEFIPSDTNTHEIGISNKVVVNISQKEQTPLYIKSIEGKRYKDPDFKIETYGGSSTGNTIISCDNSDVLLINGDMATIVGVGEATITATKLGDDIYKDVTASQKVVISRALVPDIKYPVATELEYGQKLSDSILNGGSTEYGQFVWENADIVPEVSNNGYNVKFIPNENTLKYYEDVQNKIQKIKVGVKKGNPTLEISSKVLSETNSKNIELNVEIDKIGYGNDVTGKVDFINIENDKNVNIGEANIKDGVATVIWKDVPRELLKIKVIYSGDNNYQSVASKEIVVDVRKIFQDNFTITTIPNKTYGDTEFVIETTGALGIGKESFISSDSSVISISGNIATIHKAGAVEITATKSADNDYNNAVSTVKVIVNKKTLTITAEDKLNIIKNSSMPALTYQVNGFVNNDKFITAPVLTSQVADTNKVGEYSIVVSGANVTNAESYNIVYVNGKLGIVDNNLDKPEVKPEVKPDTTVQNNNTNTVVPNSPNSITNNNKPSSKPSNQKTDKENEKVEKNSDKKDENIKDSDSENITESKPDSEKIEDEEINSQNTESTQAEKEDNNFTLKIIIIFVLVFILVFFIVVRLFKLF